MQCQACKQRTATIHLTEISNGQRIETHLCETCAQKQGIAIKNQIPLNELLSTLLAVQADAKTTQIDLTDTDPDAAPSLAGCRSSATSLFHPLSSEWHRQSISPGQSDVYAHRLFSEGSSGCPLPSPGRSKGKVASQTEPKVKSTGFVASRYDESRRMSAPALQDSAE